MKNAEFIKAYAPFAQRPEVQKIAHAAREKPGGFHVYMGDYARQAERIERAINGNLLLADGERLAHLNTGLRALRKRIARFYGLHNKYAGVKP